MKRIIIIVFFVIVLFICFGVPKYIELNNLSIIDKVNIQCSKDMFFISLREIQPIKDDNGIRYKYVYYKENINDIGNIKTYYYNKYKKNFYYNKIKTITTNCNNTDLIKNEFKIDTKKIKKLG